MYDNVRRMVRYDSSISRGWKGLGLISVGLQVFLGFGYLSWLLSLLLMHHQPDGENNHLRFTDWLKDWNRVESSLMQKQLTTNQRLNSILE